MTLTNDLERPAGLSDQGNKAYDAIIAVLEKNESTYTGGCKAFYSPSEWEKRGESYGLKSHLIIVHDGGGLAYAFNDDYECSELVQGMSEALKAAGLFAEPCTCWYTAIYSS